MAVLAAIAADGARMIAWDGQSGAIVFTLDRRRLSRMSARAAELAPLWVCLSLTILSAASFAVFYHNGLGLSYNDARSHLDIARRVVDGLKTGFAQLGSVWLPLPHVLMLPFVWNDFMWHSGLAGALESMASFVGTGYLIYRFLEHLGVGLLGRMCGVFVFAANLNILYLQSTAMTEPVLIATMTAAAYEFLRWQQTNNVLPLLKSAFWVFLATLVRYDGWFLLLMMAAIIFWLTFRRAGYKQAEGRVILFCTLGAFGVLLWFVWNQLIFGDALYFAFGPYSAHAQQQQLGEAGVLATKGDLLLSSKIYLYAVAYNSYALILFLGILGAIALWADRRVPAGERAALSTLWVPAIFNILALYLGFSVVFIQGISGTTWFNVRYGSLMEPSIAIFVGYLIHRLGLYRAVVLPILLLVSLVSWRSTDAVTIDDARVGASQKNVSEISSVLHERAGNAQGLVLISAASHDAIIFSSGLPMTRFIHEGTGKYWDSATEEPDQWARWIVMRTNDLNDSTFRLVHDTPGFQRYDKVASYPFADLYEIKPEYVAHVEAVGAQFNTKRPSLPSTVAADARHAWQTSSAWLAGHVLLRNPVVR
jgi:hypothetical protein